MMKIEESILILQSISSSNREGKSLDKLKNRFVDVLKELHSKGLTENQEYLLENELDSLFSKNTLEKNNYRELQTRYKSLTTFINDKLFLIPDGHYMGIGMIWGMLIGTFVLAFSIFFIDSFFKFYFPLIGILIGMVVGGLMDSEAKKQNRTVKMQMY